MKPILTLLAAALAITCSAQWSTDPANPMLATATHSEYADWRVTRDDNGGWYLFWCDDRSDAQKWELYGQHYDAAGMPQWTAGGKQILALPGRSINAIAPLRMPNGDHIIAVLSASGQNATNDTVRAIRVDYAGALVWAEPALLSVSGPGIFGNCWGFGVPQAVRSGNGAYFCYRGDSQGSNGYYVVSRVRGDGSVAFPVPGILVPYYAGYGPFGILPDGAGGMLVNWRTSNGLGSDFGCTRLDSTGVAVWGNSLVTNTGGLGFGGEHAIANGTGSSLLLAYADGQKKVQLAQVDTTGTFLFAPAPVQVCGFSSDQDSPHILLQGDTIIVVWTDNRPPASNRDLYMQQFNSAGQPLLDPDGVLVIQTNTYIPTSGLVASLNGGLLATIDGNVDGYSAMRVNADGTPAWAAPTAFCTSVHNPSYHRQVQLADGEGGIVSFWAAFSGSLYGARIYANGELGDHTGIADLGAEQASLQIFPVPASGLFSVWLPAAPTVKSVQAIDASGRSTDLPFTWHSDHWVVDPASLANGPYALRVITASAVHGGRFIRMQ